MKKLKFTKIEIDRVEYRYDPTVGFPVWLPRTINVLPPVQDEKIVELINERQITDILRIDVVVDQKTVVVSEGTKYLGFITREPPIHEFRIVRYLNIFHWVEVDEE